MTRHDDPAVLEALDGAWGEESGYLGMLRYGRFSEEAGEKLLALLDSIEVGEGERLHPDFVRLVWFAPLFAEWQTERAVERGADQEKVALVADRLRERLMEILGTP